MTTMFCEDCDAFTSEYGEDCKCEVCGEQLYTPEQAEEREQTRRDEAPYTRADHYYDMRKHEW